MARPSGRRQGHARHPLQIRRRRRRQNPALFGIAVTAAGRSGGDAIASSIPLLSQSCWPLPSSPSPRCLLIVDCCFCCPRPCPRQWRRRLPMPMVLLRPATAAKDDSTKANEGVKLLSSLSSCSCRHRPLPLSPLRRHPPTHVVVFLFVAISSSPLSYG